MTDDQTPSGAPEPTRTVVHLLRHGEVFNPDGILYGRLDGFHLSDRGHEMARVVGEHLADADITHVVASPLERAQQTATPIAAAHGLPVTTDDRVIEAANRFEGERFTAKKLLDPRHWGKLTNVVRPSWGEAYTLIAARMVDAIDAARRAGAGHEVVIVSHQLPIWTVRNHLEGKRLWHDPRQRECTLASLTSLTYEDDALVSITYSEPAAALLDASTSSVGA